MAIWDRKTRYPKGKTPLFGFIPTELSDKIDRQVRQARSTKQQFATEAFTLYTLIYELPPPYGAVVLVLVKALRRAAGVHDPE